MKTVFFMGVVMVMTLISGIDFSFACTGIALEAQDGDFVYGRTMEWGAFDLESRITLFPRGYKYVGTTPDGLDGHRWIGKYGVIGLDILNKDVLADGMNEKGLAVGLFYHPGTATYTPYDQELRAESISPQDVVAYILSQCKDIDEVHRAMERIKVVPVTEEAIGKPVEAHYMVIDPTGKAIVIEFIKGEMKIFDNPLRVITNSPTYDWHMTNLRNYINLSPVGIPEQKIADLNFTPLGGGSGMIGLPGDFTPPSRFVRAVAWSQTARTTPDSPETIYELFRILDNFNVPLGAAEGSDESSSLKGMRSSTLWTTGWDLSNRTLNYHTQHNRRVRRLDLDAVDFSGQWPGVVHIPLDDEKEQDIQEIMPTGNRVRRLRKLTL